MLESETFLPLAETEDKGVIDVGKILGDRFEILAHIGEGGMGCVYRAKDCQTGRLVAVKVLFLERVPDARAVARFQQEARAAARLDHPCIAQVYDFGIADTGQSYLVMELFEGRTLAKRIEEEGQLPIDETIKIFVQVCEGLAHAHKNKILHRDLKPSNIMLTTGDDNSPEVKILDFGIAKIRETAEPSLHITQTGEVLGSPFYMSPEQAKGNPIDQRSDLYSLGCALYEALTGGPPHIGQSAMSTLLLREIDKPLAMSEASLGRKIPPQLEQIVARLLKRDQNERYQSALAVKNALLDPLVSDPSAESKVEIQSKNALEENTTRRLQLKYLGALAICIVIVGAGAFWFLHTARIPKAIDSTLTNVPQPSIEPIKMPKKLISAFTLEGQAADAQRKKRYEQSARLFKDAIQCYVANFGVDSIAEAADWDELANTYSLMHDDKEQMIALDNAIRIYAKHSPSYDEQLAPLNYRLAGICSRRASKGNREALVKGANACERAGSLYQSMVPVKNIEAAMCYEMEGKDYFNAGDYALAEKPLEKAAFLFAKNRKGRNEWIDIQCWLGQCYRNQGKFEQARDCDLQSVGLLRQFQSTPPVMLTLALAGLAADYRQLSGGKNISLLNDSISLDEEILKYCNQFPKQFESKRIHTLMELADDNVELIAMKGESAAIKAKGYYKEVISRCRSSGSPNKAPLHSAYERLGQLEATQKHFDLARHFFALAMKTPYGDRSSEAKLTLEDQLYIAKTYREQGNFPAAERLYKAQLKSAEKLYGPDSYKAAGILAALGFTYKLKGNLIESKRYYEMSVGMNNRLQAESPFHPDDHRFENIEKTLSEVNSLLKNSGRASGSGHPSKSKDSL